MPDEIFPPLEDGHPRNPRRKNNKSLIVMTELGNEMRQLDGFLSTDECRAWIAFGENYHHTCNTAEKEVGFVKCFQEESSEYAFRRQGRIEIDAESVASSIFARLLSSNAFPIQIDGLKPLCCTNDIRLYRYEKGDAFGRHVDESNEVFPGCYSFFTCLVYLNGNDANDSEGFTEFDENGFCGLHGGATSFYESHNAKCPSISIRPDVGRCLLHAHGNRCMTHEAEPVINGCKFVLRTDVVYGLSKRPSRGAVAKKHSRSCR